VILVFILKDQGIFDTVSWWFTINPHGETHLADPLNVQFLVGKTSEELLKDFVDAFLEVENMGSIREKTAAEWFEYWGKAAWLPKEEWGLIGPRGAKHFQTNLYIHFFSISRFSQKYFYATPSASTKFLDEALKEVTKNQSNKRTSIKRSSVSKKAATTAASPKNTPNTASKPRWEVLVFFLLTCSEIPPTLVLQKQKQASEYRLSKRQTL